MLARVLDAPEDVQRAAGDALPEQDVAGAGDGQRGDHEQLADARHQVAAHRLEVVLRARAEAVHIGDREGALRRVVRRPGGVAAEHRDQLALAGGDQDQVVGAGEVVEVRDGDAVDDHLAAALGEGLQPAGHLDPLVDRLPVAVQLAHPVDHPGGLRAADRDAEPLDLGCGVLPEVDAQLALVAQRGVEHALGGEHPPVAYLGRGAVGHHRHVVAVRLEAQRQLESGLPGPDDQYLAHRCLPSCLVDH